MEANHAGRDGVVAGGPGLGPGGLCGRCAWARRVTSAKGSAFLRCGRSDDDPQYPRYPALPVARCAGFEQRSAD